MLPSDQCTKRALLSIDVVPSGFLTSLHLTILFTKLIRLLDPDSSLTKALSSTYVFGSKGLGSIPIMFETLIKCICKRRAGGCCSGISSSNGGPIGFSLCFLSR
nr:hypothetical protein Iba_chr03bCG7470 [Ipomoea batatas]GMC74182.1 hypothetical protein Iba_chr03cCG7840 [Ipomoea batatas]GMC75427.1 hypothetical protein Iba_chr03dCG4850 [Ipomoea batatas]